MSVSGEFTGAPGEAAPRGFRWWRVSPGGELYSAWFDQPWDQFSNEATCAIPVSRVTRRAWAKRHAEGVPAPGCSCGFYALHRVPEQAGEEPDPEKPWLLDPEGWSGLGASVVFGVAEAWGRVLIGTEGWRSRFSRALALYVPQTSDLWSSDRLRLLSERYSVPITSSLESLEAEWAPDPIDAEPPVRRMALPIGLDVRAALQAGGVDERRPDHWLPVRPDGGAVVGGSAIRPSRQPQPDVGSRIERQVSAIERLVGPGAKRILELGTGAGYHASPLAERGHSVVAVAGDFARVDLPGPFDVVGYFGGFGAGSDEEQRSLLRHVAHWVEPDGCVLIEVLTPWYWASAPRQPDRFPKGEPAHEWMFDADSCRMQVRASPLWDEGATGTQALRCYSPADLRLLLENTGLVLDALEPFASEGYEAVPSLESAKLYLARLVRQH